MIIILSIILSIIATILLVGQYYKIAADYKYYIADKAFYKYKNDVPFQKNVNRRKELKTYEFNKFFNRKTLEISAQTN